MDSVLDPEASGLDPSPFTLETLYSHSASLSTQVYNWVSNPAMD